MRDVVRRGRLGALPSSLRLSGLIVACALSGPAQALGLGDVTARSALGEPLRVDIALRTGPGEDLDAACFRLIQQRSAGSDIPWLTRARLALDGEKSARKLTITSLEPANDPILMIGLRVSCGYGLVREYTVLLSPPEAVRVVVPPTADRPREGAIARRDGKPVVLPGPAAVWEIAEGETLASIAVALYPESRRLQRQFIAAAHRANPALLAGATDAGKAALPAGAKLVLPSPRETAGEVGTTRPSAAMAKRSEADASPSAAAKPRRVERPRDQPADSAPPGRLRISGSAEGEMPLKLSTLLNEARTAKVTEVQRELLRQERRLLEALQEKIVEELALADKIRRMEERLADLQASLVRLDQQFQSAKPGPTAAGSAGQQALPPVPAPPSAPPASAAAPSKAPAATPPQESSKPAKRTDLSDWILTVGAAVLVGGLLGALVYLRRRRTEEEAEFLLADFEETGEPEAPLTTPDDEYMSTMKLTRPVLEAAAAEEKRPDEYETVGQPLTLEDHDMDVAEHESAIELAEIMLSFGRVKGAAQTLADYVESNPKQAVQPWLKLLDVYRGAGMKAEWEALARRLHSAFNVEVLDWDGGASSPAAETLEGYPHLVKELQAVWGTQASLDYLNQLLKDNRNGMRSGFPLGVLNEILTLISVLELQKPLPEAVEPSETPTQEAFG